MTRRAKGSPSIPRAWQGTLAPSTRIALSGTDSISGYFQGMANGEKMASLLCRGQKGLDEPFATSRARTLEPRASEAREWTREQFGIHRKPGEPWARVKFCHPDEVVGQQVVSARTPRFFGFPSSSVRDSPPPSVFLPSPTTWALFPSCFPSFLSFQFSVLDTVICDPGLPFFFCFLRIPGASWLNAPHSFP